MTLTGTAPVTALHPAASDTQPGAPNGKLHNAAVEFESLLIGDMLRSTRESGGGWMGSGEDESADSMIDMAEQQFARIMASGGGLGVAKLITEGLAQAADRKHSADQPSVRLSSSAIRSAYSSGI